MKLTRLTLSTLALMGVMISSCSSVSHPVGSSIERLYDFYFDEQLVGHLELSDGHYSLALLRDDIQFPEGAVVNNEFFVRHPQGLYSIEYYGSVEQDTLLENLADYAILLTIRLDVESGSESVRDPLVEDLFVIAKRDGLLYLGDARGLIQGWRAEKPWK